MLRRLFSTSTRTLYEQIDHDFIQKNVNKVTLFGIVAFAPKFYEFKNGNGFASKLLLRTQELKTSKDGEKVRSVTHTIKSFSQQNYEFLKNEIKEGDHLYIEGKIAQERSIDEQGKKIFNFFIQVDGPNARYVRIPPGGDLPESQ